MVLLEALESRQLLSADSVTVPIATRTCGVSALFVAANAPAGNAASGIAAASQSAVAVTIPDPNLEAAIRSALNKPTGDITDVDMLGLTSLTANFAKIADLTGLQYATNLTQLSLISNNITDISALGGLTNLTALFLDTNQITNLAPLESLTHLTGLYLTNNEITDVSPLQTLTNLTHVELLGNTISDISPLGALDGLTWLLLNNNHISNISALAGLTNLQTLNLRNNQITDASLGALSGLKDLTFLDLRLNQITDVHALSGLSALTNLYLDTNQITDLSPLASLTLLQTISLTSNELTDVSMLAGLTALTTVDVSHNYLNLAAGSANAAAVQALRARHVTVTDTPQDTPPALTVSDDSGTTTDQSVTLPPTIVGDTSAVATFTLANLGSRALDISNFLTGGSDPTSFQITVLSDNGTAVSGGAFSIAGNTAYTVNVTLHPASVGTKSATISFNTDDSHSPSITLNMSGIGVAVTPATLSVTDNSGSSTDRTVTLPNTPPGATSAPAMFTLADTGNQPLVISSFALSGANASDFVCTIKDSGGTPVNTTTFGIAGGFNFTVEVRLRPRLTGAKTARITFNTNDSSAPSVTLSISGKAVALRLFVRSGSALTELPASPATPLSFGTIAKPGLPGMTREFQIRNAGRQTITLGALHLPRGYKVVQSPPPSLAAGKTAVFTIQFVATAAGTSAGSISFATNDPLQKTYTIPVTGIVRAKKSPLR